MDLATYEQLTITPEALGDATKYLIDDMEIKIEVFEGKIMGI
jgi:elongation factor P